MPGMGAFRTSKMSPIKETKLHYKVRPTKVGAVSDPAIITVNPDFLSRPSSGISKKPTGKQGKKTIKPSNEMRSPIRQHPIYNKFSAATAAYRASIAAAVRERLDPAYQDLVSRIDNLTLHEQDIASRLGNLALDDTNANTNANNNNNADFYTYFNTDSDVNMNTEANLNINTGIFNNFNPIPNYGNISSYESNFIDEPVNLIRIKSGGIRDGRQGQGLFTANHAFGQPLNNDQITYQQTRPNGHTTVHSFPLGKPVCTLYKQLKQHRDELHELENALHMADSEFDVAKHGITHVEHAEYKRAKVALDARIADMEAQARASKALTLKQIQDAQNADRNTLMDAEHKLRDLMTLW